jgi:GNAT superfamily N-acetyltransferase
VSSVPSNQATKRWWRAPGKPELTAAYCNTHRRVFETSGKFLFNTDENRILNEAPFLFGLLKSESLLTAGLRVSLDGVMTGHIDGLVTLPEEVGRGNATELLRYTIDVLRTRFRIPRARVAIPIYAGQSERIVSLFELFGFTTTDEMLVRISGSMLDRHFWSSSPDRTNIRMLILTKPLVDLK